MYACGLRISEAATLEIGAIDRANMQLRIIGKGDRERLVPLPQPVLDGLGALWKTHRDPRWLFPNRSGAPANQQVLRRTFQDAARAAGIKRRVTPHALRHSYATRLLESGVDTRVVQILVVHCLVTGGGVSDDGAIGDRRAEPSWFPSGPWPSSCAANSGPGCRRAVPTWFCPTPSGRSPGSYNARPGAKASRRCSIISPATSLPRRDHQHPHRRPRRRGCRHPPQASQIQLLADHPHPRPGVHAPLPPARPAEGFAQGPLLRPLASHQAQRRCPRSSAASSRPADDATSRPDRRGRR